MTLRSAVAGALVGVLGFAQTNAPRPVSTLIPIEDFFMDVSGSVSRDGRYLSFVGPKGLSLVDLATNQIRTIVTVAASDPSPWNSTISRDASSVAYSRLDRATNRNSLWVASLTGDPTPRQIYGDATVRSVVPRDWSPDGKWIAAFISTTDFKNQLALVPTEAGAPRVLKTGPLSGSLRVFFSPDGKFLAYDMPDPRISTRDIWITAVDSSKDHAVVTHRANDTIMGWTPDGTGLLFVSDRLGSNGLWSLPVRDGAPVGAPVFIKPDMGSSQSMGVTAAGALFTVTNYFRVGSIMAGAFDLTTGAVNFARDVSTDPGEDNVNPTWSPDGKYLAYVSWRSRRPFVLLVVLRMADTGGVVREIEPQLLDAGLYDWHPDGRSLLMVGEDFKGRHGAFRVDTDTGAASLVYAIPQFTPPGPMPVWSRDGRSLYYWNRDSAGDNLLIARNVASGAEKELVRRPSLAGIGVSPDGRHLATSTIDKATNERVLLLVPLDGGAPRDLMRWPTDVTPVSWTSDSKSVIAKVNLDLWVVPIDGSAPRRQPATLEPNTFKLTISPDGRKAAYRVKEAEARPLPQIWKLEHFLPAPGGR